MSELLIGVAGLLLSKWKPKLTQDRKGLLPSLLQLAGGLERLLGRKPSLIDALKVIKDPKKVDLDLLEDEISEFQQDVGSLVTDGILGNKTLSELLSSVGCIKELADPTILLTNAFTDFLKEERNITDTDNWYLYYVEDLPAVPGSVNADLLVMNAWSLWMEHADVKVERLPKRLKSAANVIIKTADLSGTVLGQANVGNPPSKFVLEIEMDRTRQWDPELFEGAVAHEIGHVLGLEHQVASGLLMSPVVPPNWRQRMATDGQRAAALDWLGPAPNNQVVQPTHGGTGLGGGFGAGL